MYNNQRQNDDMCYPESSVSSYSASTTGVQMPRQKSKKSKSRSRAASFVEQLFEEDSDSDSDSQSYLAIGSEDPTDEQLRKALAGMVNRPQIQVPGSKSNLTLPVKGTATEDLMKTFMACQKCNEISPQSKQLQCSHTICQKCAYILRTQHVDPGQWMIRCLLCHLITTWYGNNLEGLKDHTAVQQLVKKANKVPVANGIVQAKEGQITMYGDEDLTINIVSFAKEKKEIKKALDNAEKKIQQCQHQTKIIKEYEKRVNDAKTKIKKQIKQAADMYVTAIRTQQTQMIEELDEMFKNDLQPVQKAKGANESQMESLKLVTKCCNVASKILQNGGAPLDLNNFKKMVWQTMTRTNMEELPNHLKKAYKPNIHFKPNENQYDELAEKIGELLVKKQKKSEVSKKQQKKQKKVKKQEVPVQQKRQTSSSSENEEPIYDLPPELEAQYGSMIGKKVDETIYDEIPYSPEVKIDSEVFGEDLALPIPPPIPKNNHEILQSLQGDFNMTTQNRFSNKNPVDLLTKRRHAINGNASDSQESSFASDSSEEEPELKPIPATRSRKNSVRSRASGYRSRRGSRSRPGSPMTLPRRKSCAGLRDFDQESYFEQGRNERYSTATGITGYEAHPDFQANGGAMARLIRRRKSLKGLGNISSKFQQLIGSAESTPIGLNSDKLLFCIGKMRKPGCGGGGIQQFNTPPEFAISGDDTVWVADNSNGRIQIHEGVNGKIVGSFKVGIQGVGLKPRGITTMENGKKVAVSCGRFVTVWSEGGELLRQVGPHSDFGKLGGIASDCNENLILCDIENSTIVFTATGKIIYDAVTGTGNSGKSPWLGRIAVNSFDQIICPDYGTHCIRIYSSSGKFITKFGAFGVGPRQFRYPSAVAVDPENRIYVADECNNRITLFSADGEEWMGHVLTKEDGLAFPHAVSVFSDGAIAVADDNKVVKVYRGIH